MVILPHAPDQVTSVYIITCSVNDKKYVGFTKLTPEKRFRGHVMSSKNGSRFALHEAIRKHGEDKFSVNIFASCNSRQEAAETEVKLISELSTHVSFGQGYNMTRGGEGIVGLSKESLDRMALAHRKENLSQETVTAMSSAKLGKKLSKSTRDKMSIAHSGKIFSEEHKKKIGLANAGENCSRETREKISKLKSVAVEQLTLFGERIQIYPSIKDASEKTNTHWTNISGCCCGTRKSANGFLWRYLDS